MKVAVLVIGGLALTSAPAQAETFTVLATIQCPANLLRNAAGDLTDVIDTQFPTSSAGATGPVTPAQVRCAGIRVVAMDSDALWDEYCGSAFTDSRGQVRIAARCSDTGRAPQVYLRIEGRSVLGYSVGTHDVNFWNTLADALLVLGGLATGGITVPVAVVDYMTHHATYEWIKGSERRPRQGEQISFGVVDIGKAGGGEGDVSIFAARQFWATSYATQRIHAAASPSNRPMDFNYTIDGPFATGVATTVWDTVVLDGDEMLADPAKMLKMTAHEIGHVVYNTHHSGYGHWLFEDVAHYMHHHKYCAGRRSLRLAWYEGFANWISHVAYGTSDWLKNTLTLPGGTGPCPSDPGFDREGNVTAVLDALYFGPLDGRTAYDANLFSCPDGFTRTVEAVTTVVRCTLITRPICEAPRVLQRGYCVKEGIDPVPWAVWVRRRCHLAGASCPGEEAARPPSCPVGAQARDNGRICVQTDPPRSAFAGVVSLPRGDRTPDHVLTRSQPAGTLRWFQLVDVDTMINFVRADGANSHNMREFWDRQMLPWCTALEARVHPRFCNPAQSADFVPIVAPTSPSFP